MSWLFDRLTDLAVADHLTIVIDDALDDGHHTELALMLRRASSLPHTSVTTSRARRIQGGGGGAVLLASTSSEGQHLLADLGERDLAVSVGGIIPGSNIQVDAVTDLASLLDALVTLRSYAQRAVA